MLTKKFFKTKDEAEVTFEFAREDIEKVELVGEFTDWQPVQMKYNKKAQAFRTKIRLAKNESFQFRYLLDETEWENDYKADQYQANEFGTDNSIVTT